MSLSTFVVTKPRSRTLSIAMTNSHNERSCSIDEWIHGSLDADRLWSAIRRVNQKRFPPKQSPEASSRNAAVL
jgi:hypothetical protein